MRPAGLDPQPPTMSYGGPMKMRWSALLALTIAAAIVAGCAGDPDGSPLPSIVAPAQGSTLFVAAVGTAGSGSSCASPYRVAAGANTADEIQETIEQAEDTGATTVHICAGDYVLEHRLTISEPLRIVGAGIDETVLDGNHQVTIIEAAFSSAGSRLDLSDITLQNGVAEAVEFEAQLMTGGAVTAWSLTTNRVAFVNNRGAACGGAVSLLGNVFALSGGAQLYDLSSKERAAYFSNTLSTFTDTSFIDSSAHLAGGAIGGLSIDLEGVEIGEEGIFIAIFFCGSPPMRLTGSTFTGNEAWIGGAIYSVEPRTAMESGEALGANDDDGSAIALARPFTSRRMRELYRLPGLVVESSHFTDNRSTEADLFGTESSLPGLGGGAIFTNGVAHVSHSEFSGNGSPEVPSDEYDVTIEGGAIAACGYVGVGNTYEENRAINGGALAIGGSELLGAFCNVSVAFSTLTSDARLDRYRSDEYLNNFAEEHGGAIWSLARGRSSRAGGLRFSGNSAGSAQTVLIAAESCDTRDSLRLVSSWERAGRYVEGATGEVTCSTHIGPTAASRPSARGIGTLLNLGAAGGSALNLATLLQVRQAIEGLLRR